MELKRYKGFIDAEMLNILGQLDSPSRILDFLYLGSEWNASNLEELTQNEVNCSLGQILMRQTIIGSGRNCRVNEKAGVGGMEGIRVRQRTKRGDILIFKSQGD